MGIQMAHLSPVLIDADSGLVKKRISTLGTSRYFMSFWGVMVIKVVALDSSWPLVVPEVNAKHFKQEVRCLSVGTGLVT